MVTLSQNNLGARVITLVIWALAIASITHLGLRLSGSRESALQVKTADAAPAVVDPLAVARALGATAQAPALQANIASRFTLLGVVAGSPGGGAALIAIDGKPARPFRVGSTVEDGLILQSAGPRLATLAASKDGPAAVTLEMAPLRP